MIPEKKPSNFFRDNEVPEEAAYESGGEMDFYPDEMKYWSPDPEDYLAYMQSSLGYIDYSQEISDIKDKIDLYKGDDIVIKALILAALVLTESFVKSLIVRSIPELDATVSDPTLRYMVKGEINKNLRQHDGRKRLYRKFCDDQPLPDIPFEDLRNVLAHDIGKPEINGIQISYTPLTSKSDSEPSVNSIEINAIFTALDSFTQRLCSDAIKRES